MFNNRQINLMVPYSLKRGPAPVTVERDGRVLGPYDLIVTYAIPGFFTSGQLGTGQILALNEDGTLNSEANPALRETIVTLMATGFGVLNPPGDYTITPPSGASGGVAAEFYLKIATGRSTVTGMGLVSAEPIPGQVSGAIAVRAWIPPTAAIGKAAVTFSFPQGSEFETTQDGCIWL